MCVSVSVSPSVRLMNYSFDRSGLAPGWGTDKKEDRKVKTEDTAPKLFSVTESLEV